MARDRIISGIDIGTSKITTLVASVEEDGELRIIGVATTTSHGIRKGQIVNIEEATSAISDSLEAAERMAGTSVGKTFLSVGGAHIASLNSHGVVAVAEPDREITPNDVKRVIDAAKAISLPSSRDILHVVPRGFIVDGQEGIVDPVNMTGVRLEVETHMITGGSIAIRNLLKCIEDLGVEVGGLVFAGLAAAYASLSDTEKELGVVLVDVGGGTTDIAIYVDGALSYSSVIPIGAINITKDIAAGLRISLESAEKIKLALGNVPKTVALPEEASGFGETAFVKTSAVEGGKAKTDSKDEIDLSALHLTEELRTISRKTLVEGIIKPRLNEIFSMVGMEIKKSGFGGMTPSGIVLTGGGALTAGAVESARRNLAMPVHIGMPHNITGLVDEIMTPAYAVSFGLLLYGVKSDKDEGPLFGGFGKISDKIQIKGIAGKVIDLVKSFLP
ncbi:MAG: Cell division protein ftsA [Microgenomates group bacterium GW2011_GWC1_43_11]|uniref:Cell division protein FtsA n=2 Tax=Candidatus Gottesmaniibacteriota TaxID=1752720 RepID=A0A0G1KYD7_9BACT|nr:MAG: Cell division protein ftsA [Microgenomates group bacterium GW2011_GWC1_43_11]KKT38774.1 MAG: Cell division protein ftsA [Candidatus Gottesmanbacteria bacterium GW2011_GWB1_44_11c]KKT61357.1 MAG: Cell division protein ftsA [Candidatus Gottesmanbacteria bacterium GW2011_GWA1_44_24b]HCM82905.1 cell division protein FtsA [Patescibacteria group bacterium]